jgi:DNA-binding NtrC family response regulator
MDSSIYGKSPELETVLNSASLIAATDVIVLIRGESGTGKELLARHVHANSNRRDGPLVAVNCASLSGELADSALYGHRRGAFTGAVMDHAGFVGEAEGGTLLLDEIGEMPLNVQAKFLRFIETGECLPVGESRVRRANVRIIAATNRDLEAEVAAGNFRADLFHRLNVVPLELPPLRERSGDLKLLLQSLTRDLAARHGVEAPHYDHAALKVLCDYHWPGNVRELRNLCERMTILRAGMEVGVGQLPPELQRRTSSAAREGEGFSLPRDGIRLEDVETGLIRQALERTEGNRSRAARLLGLTRDTLLYRLKKYSLTEHALNS